MPRFLLVLPCLSLLMTLGAAAPVPKDAKKPVLYFQTKVGAAWVYECEGGSTYDEVVTKVEEGKDGALFVTVEARFSVAVPVLVAKFEVSSKGLFTVALGGEVCDPPICRVNLMNDPGEKWENKTTLQGRALNFGPRREAGIEEVEVPAGKFRALRVEHWPSTEPGEKAAHHTEWYAPGVGMVKLESTAKESNYVMKSYKPGKD